MPDQTIVCPHCRAEIQLTEAIAAPIAERLRRQYDVEARAREEQFARREVELAQGAARLDEARAGLDAEVNRRLEGQKRQLAEQERKKAAAANAEHLADLKAQLADKARRLDEAQRLEVQLRQERRALEEREAALKLEIERRLDEERRAIRESARKESEEAHRLKEEESQAQLATMRRQIDDLKRKAEQGSQQIQGEVLELALEGLLARQFPEDAIEPVPKGVHGGDVVQRVRDGGGGVCGTILWESKRTKTFSDGWLAKLRDDQRQARAEVAVLVSTALPADLETFTRIDGVWVTGPACAAGLATALRSGLLEAHAVRQTELGRQSKMEILFGYLAGPQFRQRVEAIYESFTVLRDDLEQEKRAMQRIWAKREKQIDRVLTSTVGLHGDVAGIIGASLPQIEALELKALGAEPEA